MSLRLRVLVLTLSGIIVIGAGAMLFVWISFRNLMRTDIERVGVPLTMVFSKQAGQLIISEDVVSLNRLVNDTKRLSDDISYAVIIDNGGNPIAHTFPSNVPPGLLSIPTFLKDKDFDVKNLNIAGTSVQDISVPILGGTLGYARIGLTGKYLEKYLKGMLLRMALGTGIILIVGVFVGIFTARGISQPIMHLVEVTDRISMGEVDVTVDVHGKDEIGKLAEAIRRMAASIKIAIKRLT